MFGSVLSYCLVQCGCLRTRLTCLSVTVLVWSLTASMSVEMHRLRAVLRMPSADWMMRLSACSSNAVCGMATLSSWVWMNVFMLSGARGSICYGSN